jgi:hypothetical protein
MVTGVLVLVLASAGSAFAQGTITNGNANFVRTDFDTTPAANFTGVSATLTQDHLFEIGWWFRVAGGTQETNFGPPGAQNYTGDTSTLNWTGLGGGAFDAVETAVVLDTGNAPESGHVTVTLVVTNTSGAPLDLNVFAMADVDLNGSTNDSATLANPNNYIQITDPSGNTAEFRGPVTVDPAPSAFLVRPFGATSVRTVLNDTAVTDFDNTGLPFGPGDISLGFQWAAGTPISIAGTRTYQVTLAVNTAAVPVELSNFSIE